MELRHKAKNSGRLSFILREELKLSASLMNKRKWAQGIFVNGLPRHTDYAVAAGDEIVVTLEEPAPNYPAEDMPISILYEDDYLLAAEKPAGMLIHPSHACLTGTFANRVLGYYQKTGQDSAFHPVTRLDRDTFGVVLLAKNSHIHQLLSVQHREGLLQKTYHALVFGAPPEACGEIDAPIARREKPSLLRYVHPEGKPSLSRYQVLKREAGYSLLELLPVTGRTHQLRVHCAYMGFPILGDPQYGTPQSVEFSESLGLHTQCLCAKSLSFAHPITGE